MPIRIESEWIGKGNTLIPFGVTECSSMGLQLEAYDTESGEKRGGLTCREIVRPSGGPRCFVVWSIGVSRRREGTGTALYLEAAKLVPGYLVPSPGCSRFAAAVWESMTLKGLTHHIDGPFGQTWALP